MSSTEHKDRWTVVARMNIALMRLSQANYFPRTFTVADSLVLRVMLQYAFLWDAEGHPATVSKMARALGLSRATTRRKLNTLMGLGYIRQEGRYYRCADVMERLQQTQAFYERYSAVIAQTYRELVKIGRKSLAPS
jgi:DNA-binding MarR family transcriptional regulator